MKRFVVAALSIAAVSLLPVSSRAENPPAGPLLDKAIKAVGGEERLGKIQVISAKSNAKITIEGNENEMKLAILLNGLEDYRAEFDGDFNGNSFKGVEVVSGGKGWRKFGEMAMEIEPDALKNEKRIIYLAAVHMNPLLLKGKSFKVEPTDGASVEGKPADALKITGPDGKESTLYLDKESGLPVRAVARVIGWMGEEYTQESTFGDYKEFDGVKFPTKLTIKRDGEEFVKEQVNEVKFLEKAAEGAFAEPK
jgi:hypothetical protein